MTGSDSGDPPAAEALGAVLSAYRADAGVLLEAGQGARAFRVSATVGTKGSDQAEPVSATSLLPKWLRANQASLPVPDKVGVWPLLPQSEKAFLETRRVTLAVPLLDDQGLVAWAGVAAQGSSAISTPAPRPHQAAQRLRAARRDASEQARMNLTARAQRLSLAGQLAAGIAHEIRNPLAAVRSMVQLMQSGTSPAPPPDMLATILRELDHMRDTLSGMLALGQPAPHRDALVDLLLVVREATIFCRPYAAQRGLHLEFVGQSAFHVLGDSHELRHVVINVVMNACQASQAGQTVLIEAKTTANSAVIRVTDAGSGMSPITLARAFEPFFTTKPDGGGLGLAVSLAAVRRHGGDLLITSDPGMGTVVTVTLPLRVWPLPDGAPAGR